ncbi:hypothetical protein [Magnetofaba australis]|uniref:Uncharacterized protein n=1 Tax=Magnetofaba australis IT-1 TaxID=1434232 RepID=A0A1Y2K7N3_9PROT|nr:hypothetical protein [Magnetofaba australis]OSM06195.1 hypothetical protein MAIT1_01172 [Magnetofaba australis IT-1]
MITIPIAAAPVAPPAMSEATIAALDALRPRIEQAREALRASAQKLGFADADFTIPPIDSAQWSLQTDPANGQDSLFGQWRNARGDKCGELIFHPDGSFHAECDIALPHPTKPNRWFVEAVTAWGDKESVKSDPRLLPALV